MASRDDAAIRDGTVDDIDAVLDLWRLASGHTSVSDDPAGVRLLLEHEAAWLLIAESRDGIAGTLVATWDGWRGSFYRLAVHPSMRRRGVATALVREGERRIFVKGARRITAMIEGADDVAASFWSTAGYRLDPKMARYIREP